MKYTKQSGVQGGWVDKTKIVDGSKCKLVSETVPSESVYEGKTIKNNVSKIRFQGEEGEAKNVNVNLPSINALIDAYGDDSKDWQGHILTAKIEDMRVGGRRVKALYLVPEGYELKEDEGGYLVITKIGEKKTEKVEETEEINAEDIPF